MDKDALKDEQGHGETVNHWNSKVMVVPVDSYGKPLRVEDAPLCWTKEKFDVGLSN